MAFVRLDQAPGSSIVLDRRMGYGTETLNFQVNVTKFDSADTADIDDVYWAITLVSDDMTTIDQTGQFRFNQRPDVVEPFSGAEPISEQRVYQIDLSGNLINLLARLSSMPTNPGANTGMM